MTCCVPATALGPVGSAVNRTSTNLHVCGTYSQWLEVGIKQIDKIQRESEGGKKNRQGSRVGAARRVVMSHRPLGRD